MVRDAYDAALHNVTPPAARPVRVLHVVGRMQRGGAETLLMHALRHIDRHRYQMDFLVHSPEPGDFDDEARALGSRVTVCPNPDHPLSYAARLARAMSDQGPYDVVHCHVHFFTGLVLWIARRRGIPVRIAHSHTVIGPGVKSPNLPRRIYMGLARKLIARHATAGLAASRDAAADLFGTHWESDPRWRVFRFGIDLAPFSERPDKAALRAELGIPPDAFVMGHVGRISKEKNHPFLLEIAAELAGRDDSTRLLLVGDGALRLDIENRARALGLAGRTVFTGSRGDVPRLMAAMDVFVLPSFTEGLPVTMVEALAAGLPCVLSDAVPEDCADESRVVRLSLQRPASEWAEKILQVPRLAQNESPAEAARLLASGPFDIATTVEELEELYDGNRGSRTAA